MSSKIFNAGEAAEFLGAHVETVRRLARKGRIPSFKLGKDWRFRRADLLKWAENHHLRNQPPVVLIVDDEAAVRKMIRQIFKRQGYHVCEALDGMDGLDVFSREKVDLIFLDLKMPVMAGVDFLIRLRKLDETVPVVLITGDLDCDQIIEAMKQSPVMLLTKPLQKKLLLRTADVLLNSHA